MEKLINSLVILIFSLCTSDGYLTATNITPSDVVNRVNFVLGNTARYNSEKSKDDWVPITQNPIWPKLARHQNKQPAQVTIDEISHKIRLSNVNLPTTEVTPKNNFVNFRFPNHKMHHYHDKNSYKSVDKVTEEVSAKVNEVNRRILSRRVDTDQSSIDGSTTRAYDKRFLNHKMNLPSGQAFLDRPQDTDYFPLKKSDHQYNATAFHSILANKSKYTQNPAEDDDVHSTTDTVVDYESDQNVTVGNVIKFKPLPPQKYVFNEQDHTASKQIIMDTVRGVTEQFFAAVYEMYYCMRYHWSQGMMKCISSRAAWVFKRRRDELGYDSYQNTQRFFKNNFVSSLSEAVAKSVVNEVTNAVGKERTMNAFEDILEGATDTGYDDDDDDDDDDGTDSDRVQDDDEDDDDDDEEDRAPQSKLHNMIDEKGHHGHHGQQQTGVILQAPQVVQPVIQQHSIPTQQVQLVAYEQQQSHHGHKKLHKHKHKLHGHHGHHAIGILGKKKKKFKYAIPLLILAKFKLMAMFFLLAGLASKALLLSKISLILALFGVFIKLSQSGHRSHGGKTSVVFAKPYSEEDKWDRRHDQKVENAYSAVPESVKNSGNEQSYYHDPYGTDSMKSDDHSYFQSPYNSEPLKTDANSGDHSYFPNLFGRR